MIGNNNHITDVGMGHIGQLSRLTALDIGSDRVTDAGLSEPPALKRLFDLNLRCKQMSDLGMAGLKEHQTHRLPAYCERPDQRHGFAAVAGKDGMNDLIVSGSRVTDEGLKNLRGIQRIGKLTLPSDKISDARP